MNKFLKILLIIAPFILVFFVLFFLSFLLPSKGQKVSPSVSPTPVVPTVAPTPTPFPVPEGEFGVLRFIPAENTGIFLPITEIEVVFNKPVAKEGFVYDVSPFVATRVRQKNDAPSSLFISPTTVFEQGVTTITIKQAFGVDGSSVFKTYTYLLQTAFPTSPSGIESEPWGAREKLLIFESKLPYYGTNFFITFDKSFKKTTIIIDKSKRSEGEMELAEYLKLNGIESTNVLENLTISYK